MKAWTLAALFLLPGGSLIILAFWLRRRLHARESDPNIARLIVPPIYRKGMTTHDEALRLRTEARRKAADAIRSRAAHVESGAPVKDVLRMVR